MLEREYGSLRERVDADELRRLKEVGAVQLDPRRSRPLWFDGRFLKASDLNREQNYFLTRQADLAVATGTGVIEGLEVEPGSSATSLVIRRGHGVTHGGERVALNQDLTVNLGDVPLIQQLNVTLGLSKLPGPPLRSRSGLYVVVVRPLEFTANPIASYPTHVDDSRSVADGEIIEATAVTLVPYAATLTGVDSLQRRADAAHRLFVQEAEAGVPTSSLPLAMIELERGNLRWVDPHLVRREAGTGNRDVLGLGIAPLVLRQAHYRQYEAMLEDVVAQRRRLNAGLRFAASEHFRSLPPAGRLPAAAVDMTTTTQHFFPDEMDVEVSFVPEDEIPALVEESFFLPPIDLTAEPETLASSAVLILVPVPRRRVKTLEATATRLPRPVRLPTPAIRSRLKPVDLLSSLRKRLPQAVEAERPALELAETDWQGEVVRHLYLTYVRRRNLSYKEDLVGESIEVFTDDAGAEANLRADIAALGLENRFTALEDRATARADANIVRLLGSEAFRASPTLTLGAVRELESAETLDERAAKAVAARFQEEGVGDGVRRVESEILENEVRADGTTIRAAANRNKARAEKLAESGALPELDAVVKRLPPEEASAFTAELKTALEDRERTAADVRALILERERSIGR